MDPSIIILMLIRKLFLSLLKPHSRGSSTTEDSQGNLGFLITREVISKRLYYQLCHRNFTTDFFFFFFVKDKGPGVNFSY